MRSFSQAASSCGQSPLTAGAITVLQVNLGRMCNLHCRHCHVGASPASRDVMDWPTMEAVLRFAETCKPRQVDITGGAPEINPHFRRFVADLRGSGFAVQVRTNLTVMFEPGQQDLPEFFRHHQVGLVASLPCYLSDNVDSQRGKGVYDHSIEALRRLNAQGYGLRADLPVNLVYNPGGPFLPPGQEMLEATYRRELNDRHDVHFTSLLTITNMPIGRFLEDLRQSGKAEDYRRLLREAFNPGTLGDLMCRHQVSIDWDGALYDCDFNLALGMSLGDPGPRTVFDIDPQTLPGRRIRTDEHCFGCTAGCGSSCGGALVA